MQKLYAVVGDPIAHSWSPTIHRQLFRLSGVEDCTYIKLHITPEQLPPAVEILRGNFQGFNVTLPHKKAIMPLLDELTAVASQCGVVNTVKCEDGRLIGHNTDGLGFTAGWRLMGWNLEGSSVLLLGAGGAARVVAHELAALGCAVTIANRTFAAAEVLAADVRSHFPGTQVKAVPWVRLAQGAYDVVVNATPVGMGALTGQSPIDLEELRGVAYVCDLIYNPPQTKLLRQGQELGLKVLNGLPMLVYQAAAAQEFWLNRRLPDEAVLQVLAAMQEMRADE